LLLLLAVPTLSTLAKDSWYLPSSNPVHFLNIASKMQLRHIAVVLDKTTLQTSAKLVPAPREMRRSPEPKSEPPAPAIGVTVSLQHRSPPFLSL
jgi:hypothetical protein